MTKNKLFDTPPHPTLEVTKGKFITIPVTDIPLHDGESIVELGTILEPSKHEIMTIVLTSEERNFLIDRQGNIYRSSYSVYNTGVSDASK